MNTQQNLVWMASRAYAQAVATAAATRIATAFDPSAEDKLEKLNAKVEQQAQILQEIIKRHVS